jgi:import inner membrane translocase subunit TIM23
MGWALIDSSIGLVRNTSDYYNHISAAFLSGFIFKSTAGLRPAFLTGSILASVVSVYGVYDKWSSGEFFKPSASTEKLES